MSRVARKISETGIYHIILRGVNRQIIFNDNEDFEVFLDNLLYYKPICEYKIYAYCLMNNHIHLLMKEEKTPLANIMRRICSRYVYWYNKKYERAGNLFQDRFKSEPVETDSYLFTVHRYIHQNPFKAGIVNNVADYSYSSYKEYIYNGNIINKDFILDMLNEDRNNALAEFIVYNNEENNDNCLEANYKIFLNDEKAKRIISKLCDTSIPTELQNFKKPQRDLMIKRIKNESNISVRQLERLTGISRGVIQRI
jgi:putative transposase